MIRTLSRRNIWLTFMLAITCVLTTFTVVEAVTGAFTGWFTIGGTTSWYTIGGSPSWKTLGTPSLWTEGDKGAYVIWVDIIPIVIAGGIIIAAFRLAPELNPATIVSSVLVGLIAYWIARVFIAGMFGL